MKRGHDMLFVSALVLGLLAGAPAMAQQEGEAEQAAQGEEQAQAAQAAGGAPVIEEVIVTAQRREQTLQEVPIAITAFEADTVENLRTRWQSPAAGAAGEARHTRRVWAVTTGPTSSSPIPTPFGTRTTGSSGKRGRRCQRESEHGGWRGATRAG